MGSTLYDKLSEPNFSNHALKVLEKRYLQRDDNNQIIENPKGMLYRVASTIANGDLQYGSPKEDVEKLTGEFYRVMADGYFLPNSPTLRGAGIHSNLAACFVLPVYDSRESIFEETLFNAVKIQAFGGGTGFNWSELRHDGALISSTKGKSAGPVSFINVYDIAIGETIAQGGVRQGANMGILNYDHPDILKFIRSKSELNKKHKELLQRFKETAGLDDSSKYVGILEELLVSKLQLTNFNLSVGVTEEFMKLAREGREYNLIDHRNQVAGKLNAREVLEEIIHAAWKKGDPGIIFLDRIDRDNATPSLGKIVATNPCVVGSALISTEFGLMRMKDLIKNHAKGGLGIVTDSRIPIKIQNMDGSIMFLEQNQRKVNLRFISCAFFSGIKPVYKLLTKSGYELEVTENHKIFTTKGKKKLIELVPGKDEVLIQGNGGVFNKNSEIRLSIPDVYVGSNSRVYKLTLPKRWSKELGQILGLLVGDGWLRDKDKNCRVGFTFSASDKEVLGYIKPLINSFYGKEIKEVKRKNGVFHLSYHSKYFVDFFKKLGVLPVSAQEKKVPQMLFEANEEAVIGFLQGLFTADGTLRDSKKSSSDWIALTSKSIDLLKEVQMLLINLGIKSRIFNRSRPPRDNLFRYKDKEGKIKHYSSDGVLYELGIFGGNIEVFKEKIGFLNKAKQDKLNKFRIKKRRITIFSDLVVSIIPCGEKEVYDLTEPATHSMICNGIVTTQCGEQPLLPYEACNLGSINLAAMVKEKSIDYELLEKTIRTGVHFLDNVIDVNTYVVGKIEEMTKGNRKIGLGVMGFGDMLIQLGIPYASEEGIAKAEEVMRFINGKAHEVSQDIAKVKGAFPNFEKSVYAGGAKIRNAKITTIAPTGTLSLLYGVTSGIEPLFAPYYERGSVYDSDGKAQVIEKVANPYLEKMLRERTSDYERIIGHVKQEGSIQSVRGVSEDIKKLFLRAEEIDLEYHLRMQSAFQKHVDNAVSKTINLHKNVTVEDVAKAFWLSYDLPDIKGLTVYRDGSKGSQVLTAVKEKPKERSIEELLKDHPESELVLSLIQQKTGGKSIDDFLDKHPVRGRNVPGTFWLPGATRQVKTGCGPIFVTVNEDRHGAVEVFTNMNPAGGCADAQTATCGILASGLLHNNGDPYYVIRHLNATNCPKKNDIAKEKCCPQAVAEAVKEYIDIRKLSSDGGENPFFKDVMTYNELKKAESKGNGNREHETILVKSNNDGFNRVDAVCPECGMPLQFGEGCRGGKCGNIDCGYANCG